MKNWQEGTYNPDYIVHLKGLIAQIKYQSNVSPGKLDEVCAERFDNGDINILFTVHADATSDSKHGGIHARLSLQSLLSDLHNLDRDTNLSFSVSPTEVYKIAGRKGMERLLAQVLMRLQEYDNSLAEIRSKLESFVMPTGDQVALVKEAFDSQKSRLDLLKKVMLSQEKSLRKRNIKSIKGQKRKKSK